MNRIVRFALLGAIGFGIGAAINAAGLAALVRADLFTPLVLRFVLQGSVFAAQGTVGGAALGLAIGRGWWKVVIFALAGAITFAIASVGGILAGLGFWIGEDFDTADFILGAIIGALGGMVFGLASGIGRRVWIPLVVGALAFGAGMLVAEPSFTTSYVNWIGWSLEGIIGGTCLGAALGYIENLEKRTTQSQS